jgi:hypothetical protein
MDGDYTAWDNRINLLMSAHDGQVTRLVVTCGDSECCEPPKTKHARIRQVSTCKLLQEFPLRGFEAHWATLCRRSSCTHPKSNLQLSTTTLARSEQTDSTN